MLTIVAVIIAKPEKREFLCSHLKKLVEPTKKEDGCIVYDLYEDKDDANTLIFYEQWSSVNHWNAHMGSEHLKSQMEAVMGCVESITMHELNKVI